MKTKHFFVESDYVQTQFSAGLLANLNEFGVIAGSNKRRATLHDVQPIIKSIAKIGYLVDRPITFVWSTDPRLIGYKTKAIEDVQFTCSNGLTAGKSLYGGDNPLKDFSAYINSIDKMSVTYRQCPKYCVNEKTGFRYFFLYLDSVFKYKNKLVHNQPPIMNWLCPFLLNFHQ